MRDQYVVSQLRVICGLAQCVSCRDATANELVLDPDHTYLITQVWVPRQMRGRRYGRIVLDRVCHDADAEGMTLILSVAPDYDSPLKYEGTIAFYQRHGFEIISDRYHGAMRRVPRLRAAVSLDHQPGMPAYPEPHSLSLWRSQA